MKLFLVSWLVSKPAASGVLLDQRSHVTFAHDETAATSHAVDVTVAEDADLNVGNVRCEEIGIDEIAAWVSALKYLSMKSRSAA